MTKKQSARRGRSDSTSTEKEMAQAEAPQPPRGVELPDYARAVFDSIVRARDYNAWTEVDLHHAVNLATCLADLEHERKMLREEGNTVVNAKGTPVQNPRLQVTEVLSRRSVAITRLLHVHPEATEGESRHQKKRSSKQREVEDAKKEKPDDNDDLIARPTH